MLLNHHNLLRIAHRQRKKSTNLTQKPKFQLKTPKTHPERKQPPTRKTLIPKCHPQLNLPHKIRKRIAKRRMCLISRWRQTVCTPWIPLLHPRATTRVHLFQSQSALDSPIENRAMAKKQEIEIDRVHIPQMNKLQRRSHSNNPAPNKTKKAINNTMATIISRINNTFM